MYTGLIGIATCLRYRDFPDTALSGKLRSPQKSLMQMFMLGRRELQVFKKLKIVELGK